MDMKRDYYEDVEIFASDAVVFWFVVLGCFLAALAIGHKRATLKMNFEKVPLYPNVLFNIGYLAVFRKLKKGWGLTGYGWPIPARPRFHRRCSGPARPSGFG
ncbi:MAG: hypothetical protein SWC96_11150 [Thermodesulfobacteriota bacterium]|nr:hypothetical protein [Thermodesulfobacteriota bacterium]